ncbi:hypothetical protein [Lysobacter sp. Root690]|uniref:hypothetical protein n=1 Tax=Lysobacter sp. Root690 TaxID=1736588 RepID=UPI0006F53B4E|nr:hypothetical protein [Lysobacter sp. Root690]KRB03385.1 hypothetical protein ASD86_21160 [Lysobacter sp. Root690]
MTDDDGSAERPLFRREALRAHAIREAGAPSRLVAPQTGGVLVALTLVVLLAACFLYLAVG